MMGREPLHGEEEEKKREGEREQHSPWVHAKKTLPQKH